MRFVSRWTFGIQESFGIQVCDKRATVPLIFDIFSIIVDLLNFQNLQMHYLTWISWLFSLTFSMQVYYYIYTVYCSTRILWKIKMQLKVLCCCCCCVETRNISQSDWHKHTHMFCIRCLWCTRIHWYLVVSRAHC